MSYREADRERPYSVMSVGTAVVSECVRPYNVRIAGLEQEWRCQMDKVSPDLSEEGLGRRAGVMVSFRLAVRGAQLPASGPVVPELVTWARL